MIDYSYKGAWSFCNFDTRNHISGTTEATLAKICMHVEYIKCLAFDNRQLSNRRGQRHVTRFFKFCRNRIFEISEVAHFKFRLLIDT